MDRDRPAPERAILAAPGRPAQGTGRLTAGVSPVRIGRESRFDLSFEPPFRPRTAP